MKRDQEWWYRVREMAHRYGCSDADQGLPSCRDEHPSEPEEWCVGCVAVTLAEALEPMASGEKPKRP